MERPLLYNNSRPYFVRKVNVGTALLMAQKWLSL